MTVKDHWEHVYASRATDQCSWHQVQPRRSLNLIEGTGVPRGAAILDVGGGDSLLADHLVAAGYRDVTVVDISRAALQRSQGRLPADGLVHRVQADARSLPLADASVDVWHDRAVFHFLTDSEDRDAYLHQVRRVVRPGGHVIVATFAADGPTRCSGLPAVRYSSVSLHETFGPRFRLVDTERETHRTPAGVEQQFVYCSCVLEPSVESGAAR
jgi:ubiquinone/menaquinone biosynthesis C-methylase UbiE